MPITSEVYKEIYHYTTFEGLIGILKSKSLWATHCKFLNDYSEINLFRSKFISLMHPHVRECIDEIIKQYPQSQRFIDGKGGLDHFTMHEARNIVNAQYSALGYEIYITSFCGQHKNTMINENGLLSQWRAYGNDGGVALVFDTKKLEEILLVEFNKYEYNMVHLSDVVYSDDEKKLDEELSPSLSIMASTVKKLLDPRYFKERATPDLSEGFIPFVNCITRYKHYGFSEENEVRIVVLPTVINQEMLRLVNQGGGKLKPEKERMFRDKNGRLIPYIELFKSIDIELPINRIIIGPHKEQEARADTLSVMLRNKNIKISRSDIPFVG